MPKHTIGADNLTSENYDDESTEPRYVDIDELQPTNKRPKWQLAKTDFHKRILKIFNYKYFPSKDAEYRVRKIEKSMLSLENTISQNNPAMPTEWVEFCIEWVIEKRSIGKMVSLEYWLNWVYRKEAIEEFCSNERRRRQLANKPIKNQ
jgi:hypothetical protein